MRLQPTLMAANQLVPCYYTGQNRRVEPPAEFRLRPELHEIKKQKLGTFVDNGKNFLFAARRRVRVFNTLWEGRPSSKSILAFLKTNSYGDRLHYEIPRAGDRGLFARHHRPRIRVSSRVAAQFRIQQIPA